MKKTKNKALMLVTSQKPQKPDQEVVSKPNDNTAFIRKLLRHEDKEQVSELIANQAALEFDRENPERDKLTLEQAEINARHKLSDKKLMELEGAVNATPRHIKCVAEDENGDIKNRFFTQWKKQDQWVAAVLLAALVTAFALASGNVYVTLMASGEAVFLNQPKLAFLISLLAPTGSLAFKFVGHAFENYKHIKWYCNTIYGLTSVSFLMWVALFSASYSSVTSGIDWGALGQSSSALGSWLVFTQLMTEILVGAALSLALGNIALKYSSDLYRENHAFVNAVSARDSHLKHHTALTQLEAERQAAINHSLAEYFSRSSRIQEINQL
ncbi:hypothetical protein AB835_10855 [Candidatus Endobugula sertula]|uniref:Uncharacterized protein n=1 Tax=Candidatus Endobugula sertula TaxID=62101 RepID=A0A1D2QNB0_9GAMM|nr:hypothetical protein AB835_10855 [Candidatus Endobugula sertula]